MMIPIKEWALKARPDLAPRSAVAQACRFSAQGKLKGAELAQISACVWRWRVPESTVWPRYQKKQTLCAKCKKKIGITRKGA